MNKKKVLVIAAVLMMLIAAVAVFLLTRPQGIIPSAQELQDMSSALENEGKGLAVSDSFRMTVDPDDLSITAGLDESWTHVLLLGTDAGSGNLDEGRSDAMVVASINTKPGEIKISSLVRDMLVDIPGMKSQQRVNTANAFGGPLLAVKTVNELLGLNISRYVSASFPGFGVLVELMGGIELTLSKGEAKLIHGQISDEPQIVVGWQALEYARIRRLDNNFGRNERQRNVLSAVLDKAMKLGPKELLALLPEALKYVSTNMTTSEILDLMPVVLSNTQGIEMLSLPPEKTFRYGQANGDSSVIIFNLEKTRAAFHDFIAGKPAEQEQTEEKNDASAGQK